MKKLVWIAITAIMLLIISACGNADSTSGTEDPKGEAAASDQEEVSNQDASEDEDADEETSEKSSEGEDIPKVEKDENGNYILTTVGQTIDEPDTGTIELMKIKDVNETVDISPIKVTVKDIKLFQITDVQETMIDYLSMYGLENTAPEKLNYIQIAYKSENTEDKDIDWYGIQNVVLSNGEQLDAMMNDFISDDHDMDTIYYGNVKKDGTVGLLYKGNPEEVESVKIIFGESMDAESYETLTEKQQVEYEL